MPFRSPMIAEHFSLRSINCYPFGYVSSLKQLCLKCVVPNVKRHALKFDELLTGSKEYSLYMNFLQIYKDHLSVLPVDFPESSLMYEKCLKFLCNQFTENIDWPLSKCFETKHVKYIISNCQNIQDLQLVEQTLNSPNIHCLLQSLKNLKRIEVGLCSFRHSFAPELMNSFAHLQELVVTGCSSFNDDCIFLLCCKKRYNQLGSQSCIFDNDCPSNTLSLRHIIFQVTGVSSVGISCLLTHIPTLKELKPLSCPRFIVSNVISDICFNRDQRRMPAMSFQLEELYLADLSGDSIEKCLRACPKLQTLSIKLWDKSSSNDHVDEVLAKEDLSHVNNLLFVCSYSERLYTEELKPFWEKNGPHLSVLAFSPENISDILTFDPDVFQKIVGHCPSLMTLELGKVSFRSTSVSRSLFRDSLKLYCLKSLFLNIVGDPYIVNKMACQIISLAPNIIDIYLHFKVITEVFTAFLTKESFPHLKSLNFVNHYQFRGDLVDVKFKEFLWSHNLVGRVTKHFFVPIK